MFFINKGNLKEIFLYLVAPYKFLLPVQQVYYRTSALITLFELMIPDICKRTTWKILIVYASSHKAYLIYLILCYTSVKI